MIPSFDGAVDGPSGDDHNVYADDPQGGPAGPGAAGRAVATRALLPVPGPMPLARIDPVRSASPGPDRVAAPAGGVADADADACG